MTKVHGFEEVFNLVYFLLLSSKKGTVSIPLHPSRPGLQLIAALQKEKGRVGRETDEQTDKERERHEVIKSCIMHKSSNSV